MSLAVSPQGQEQNPWHSRAHKFPEDAAARLGAQPFLPRPTGQATEPPPARRPSVPAVAASRPWQPRACPEPHSRVQARGAAHASGACRRRAPAAEAATGAATRGVPRGSTPSQRPHLHICRRSVGDDPCRGTADSHVRSVRLHLASLQEHLDRHGLRCCNRCPRRRTTHSGNWACCRRSADPWPHARQKARDTADERA